MTDDELDELVAATAAITDERLTDLDLQVAATELCEEIMSTSVVEATQSAHPTPSSPPRKRRWVAAAAAAAVLVAGLGVTLTSIGGGANPAWAAPLVAFAESSPQLLLDSDGWEVSRADENGEGEGEMTFMNGDREADLHWRAGSFEEWAEDRAQGAARIESETVLGVPAQVTQYPDTDEYTAIWPQGDQTIEFRTVAESYNGFVDLLGDLRRVDVDTWLSAMPDSVIQAAERRPAVEEILVGIPVPGGLDVNALVDTSGISDRYQFGADVTRVVGCAWADQWVAAMASGDTASADEAAQAMATSHDWAILAEMSNEGAWPQVFWMVADAIAGDGITEDGVPVADIYPNALGCQ